QRFDITVTHPDYDDAYRPVPVGKDTTGDIPVRISLKRKSDRKVVAVQLNAAGDKAPIYDAQISLKGTKSPTAFTGTTDSSGHALINVTEADDYEVAITHNGYE